MNAIWTSNHITNTHGILVENFVFDHPRYHSIVKDLDLKIQGNFVKSGEAIRNTKLYFDVSITTHEANSLFDDLRRMGKAEMEHRQGPVEGFMSPEFRGSNRFYIALSSFHNKSVVPVGTLLHELGHLVEEQVRWNTKSSKSSSFINAKMALISSGIDAQDERKLNHLSDEWVAWINAIWIAMLMGVDVRHAMLGMVMDESQWPNYEGQTISQTLRPLKAFILTQEDVAQRLKVLESGIERCTLINELSAAFFASLNFGNAGVGAQHNIGGSEPPVLIRVFKRIEGEYLLKSIPKNRQKDCTKLVAELKNIGVFLTDKQVHFLWSFHSLKNDKQWDRLQMCNIKPLESKRLPSTVWTA